MFGCILRAHWQQVRQSLRQTIQSTIKNGCYIGEKQNWLFQIVNYIAADRPLTKSLEEFGKPEPPAKQEQDLFDSIYCSSRMLVATLATFIPTSNLCEDFQAQFVYPNSNPTNQETSP